MLRATCRAGGAFALAIMLALGVMARTGAADVREFEQIAASSIVITPDPGGRAATLEVDTTIDVACSVVYGTDETFGLIAVDSDMGGGAHADHQPLLGGLEPDTTYLYRVQGTAADGTIYVSEVMTFSTPAAAAGPTNLALGASVTGVSSEWSEAFAAENAIDGDPSTEWSSQGDGDEAWVELDLGTSQRISGLEYRTRSMADGSAIASTITVTADGVELGEFATDRVIGLEREARVLRIDVMTSTGGNTGAVEILVYAADGAE